MSAMRRLLVLAVGMCLTAAMVTACSRSDTATETRDTGTATLTAGQTPAESPGATAAQATITIANLRFGDPVTVPPGASVAVTNNDSVEHSVTSKTAGKFDVHVDGNKQGTFTAPTEPGEYPFYCVYHPAMLGTLIVK